MLNDRDIRTVVMLWRYYDGHNGYNIQSQQSIYVIEHYILPPSTLGSDVPDTLFTS